MLMGGLGMAVGLHRFVAALGVFAFAVMVGRRPVALRRIFMMFCCFGMGFLRHTILRCRVGTAGERLNSRCGSRSGAIVVAAVCRSPTICSAAGTYRT